MSRRPPRVIVGTLFLVVGSFSIAQVPTEAPDFVLLNGRVFTATEAHPYAEAIAIKGSRIFGVGTNQNISAMAGPSTRRIDVRAHVIIPGLNDVHTHFGADFEGTVIDFVGLDPECSQVLNKVRQEASKAAPGMLLFE